MNRLHPKKYYLALTAALLACLGPLAYAQLQLELNAGIHVIHVEVAHTSPSRMLGLMHREHMEQNRGMLFVFPEPERVCMWMKNTLIPLSTAFMDDKGAIINIEDMAPQTETAHCATRLARYALEMNQGWFKSHGIEPGSKIQGVEHAPAPR